MTKAKTPLWGKTLERLFLLFKRKSEISLQPRNLMIPTQQKMKINLSLPSDFSLEIRANINKLELFTHSNQTAA